VSAPEPYLRRRPAPPPGNGRKVLIACLGFLLALVVFVVVLYLAIGRHTEGPKPPPAPASHASQRS
jgi:hypothetical protein